MIEKENMLKRIKKKCSVNCVINFNPRRIVRTAWDLADFSFANQLGNNLI